MPVSPTGDPINAHNAAHWLAEDDIPATARRGFVLNGDGIVCVDIDHCLDHRGAILPWAQRFLDLFPDTFVEISPSGDGLHVWGVGSFPECKITTYRGRKVEFYADRRFITVTGNPWPRCATHLADMQEVLDRFM